MKRKRGDGERVSFFARGRGGHAFRGRSPRLRVAGKARRGLHPHSGTAPPTPGPIASCLLRNARMAGPVRRGTRAAQAAGEATLSHERWPLAVRLSLSAPSRPLSPSLTCSWDPSLEKRTRSTFPALTALMNSE